MKIVRVGLVAFQTYFYICVEMSVCLFVGNIRILTRVQFQLQIEIPFLAVFVIITPKILGKVDIIND